MDILIVRVLLLALLLFSIPAKAEAVVYQIKASYIYNFVQFIRFSDRVLTTDNRLTVCIVGENRFGSALNEVNGASTPQGVIQVKFYPYNSSAESIRGCHVLYLVGTDESMARRLLSTVDTSEVLTIGEFSRFIHFGGFIELFVQDDSIRFRVNQKLAGATHFQVPAQLLSLGAKS